MLSFFVFLILVSVCALGYVLFEVVGKCRLIEERLDAAQLRIVQLKELINGRNNR